MVAATRGVHRVRSADDPVTPGDVVRLFLVEMGIIVVVSLVLATLLKTFVVQAFYVPTGSMLATIQLDERILVNKLSPGLVDLHRGDVVVFEDPGGWLATEGAGAVGATGWQQSLAQAVGLGTEEQATHVVKRVVGLPGDTVSVDDDGVLSVNGVVVDERAYLYPGDVSSETAFTITVPDDALWVMGDHRSDSDDSRVHGTVPLDDVVGVAMAVVWPLDDLGALTAADDLRAVPRAEGY